MSEHIPIPVEAAAQIADKFRKSIVVILALDPVSKLVHVTTFGETALDKAAAAHVGDICAKAAGCDLARAKSFEDFRGVFDAALYKQSIDLLRKVYERDLEPIWMLKKIETLLTEVDKPR